MKTYKAKVELFRNGSLNEQAVRECGTRMEACILHTLQTVFDEALTLSMEHLDALCLQKVGSSLLINVSTEGSLEVCDKEGYLSIKTSKWDFRLQYDDNAPIHARLSTVPYVFRTSSTLDNRTTQVNIFIVPEGEGQMRSEITLSDVTAETFESVQNQCFGYGYGTTVKAITLLSEQEEVA
ncbi:MAG TPA: hypothetical protein DCW74_03530 [Alteromonas australica]|uniref:Uncharacterized protein n=1 Tax=Alteromonas australica TaxID=589873 RepID=A0A350P0H2_9ALTE|nr:hypothetical protein [Alteromonas australica]|tara:strand:+ start:553 stop:1095 length:543 start_codon:yes stop_codon:yes gene_type:complete